MRKQRNMIKPQLMLLIGICLMLFIDALGEGLTYPVLPELFKNNSWELIPQPSFFSPDVLYSLSLALFPLACLIGMPLLGSLSDTYGRPKIILFGLSGLVLSYLINILSILIQSVWLFLLSTVLRGFFSGTYAVGNAVLSDLSQNQEERLAYFKLPALMSILGFILGPSLSILNGVFLFSNVLITPFVIAFILGALNLVLLLFTFKRQHAVSLSSNLDILTTDQETTAFKEKYMVFATTIKLEFKAIFERLKDAFTTQSLKGLCYTYLLIDGNPI